MRPSLSRDPGRGNRSRGACRLVVCTRTFPEPPRMSLLPGRALVRVAVGSTNPVKVGAARRVVTRLAAVVEVTGVAVPSGVPDQPWGDEETIRGARTRARAAGHRPAGRKRSASARQ